MENIANLGSAMIWIKVVVDLGSTMNQTGRKSARKVPGHVWTSVEMVNVRRASVRNVSVLNLSELRRKLKRRKIKAPDKMFC